MIYRERNSLKDWQLVGKFKTIFGPTKCVLVNIHGDLRTVDEEDIDFGYTLIKKLGTLMIDNNYDLDADYLIGVSYIIRNLIQIDMFEEDDIFTRSNITKEQYDSIIKDETQIDDKLAIEFEKVSEGLGAYLLKVENRIRMKKFYNEYYKKS